MNKMKLAGIALVLFFGVVVKGVCAVNPPRDSQGVSLPTIDFVGAKSCVIGNSTGTAVVLCATGRVVVYGVIVSSVPTTDFVVFRDTSTANFTSSTATVVYASGSNSNATGVATQFFLFPVPMKFSSGLSINASVAPTAGNGSSWTILYRPMNATE